MSRVESAPATGTVALTGATGFVGAAFARRLAAAGWSVRALVRPRSDRSRLPRAVQLVEGSLEDEAALGRLVAGVDAVVHAAGSVRGATSDAFRRTNVEGTRRLARAAAALPRAPRFVLVSSLAARVPHLSPYAASKRAGEEALAAEGLAAAVALRPPAVYGPGDRELLPLLRCVARGLAPMVGPADARVSLVHVDDLAEALVRLLAAAPAPAGTFEVCDGAPAGYSWEEIVRAVARLAGRRVLRVRIPLPFVTALGAANAFAGRVLGRAPMLTPGKARELGHPDWLCDNVELTLATGWVPEVRLEEGLRRTLALPPPRSVPVARRP